MAKANNKAADDSSGLIEDRIKQLENTVVGLIEKIGILETAILEHTPVQRVQNTSQDAVSGNSAVESLGSVGVDATPFQLFDEEENFLMTELPKIFQRIIDEDKSVVADIVNLLTSKPKARYKDFFLVWFACSEEIRKVILISSICMGVQLPQGMFNLMRLSLSQEAIDDVNQTYTQLLDNSLAKEVAENPDALDN